MTKVINLLAGPGAGKTTTAWKLASLMRDKGLDVEITGEHLKTVIRANQDRSEIWQAIHYGKQLQLEAQFYGKVDYIISDSPLILFPVYQQKNFGHRNIETQVLHDLLVARSMGIDHVNFYLNRRSKYDDRGRAETEEEAVDVDLKLRQYLAYLNTEIVDVNVKTDQERVAYIMHYLEALDS
jgi:hypothetical protein